MSFANILIASEFVKAELLYLLFFTSLLFKVFILTVTIIDTYITAMHWKIFLSREYFCPLEFIKRNILMAKNLYMYVLLMGC